MPHNLDIEWSRADIYRGETFIKRFWYNLECMWGIDVITRYGDNIRVILTFPDGKIRTLKQFKTHQGLAQHVIDDLRDEIKQYILIDGVWCYRKDINTAINAQCGFIFNWNGAKWICRDTRYKKIIQERALA